MWEGLLNRLRGHNPAPALPEPDHQLALGALLVRVAKSDRHYDATEIGEIDRILAASFNLKPVEAARMRATCEKLEKQAPGTADFARIIVQTVDYPHRLDMVHALWRVIMADGMDTPEEDATLHEIERALAIDPGDSPVPR
ncbi:Uncharacterized conserved protein, tellurite resistance protein B (TerB) family [Salinihabitans flavidus]|uniref:Uncharacterized conserved protein, tellurite resistance protein B (TerB) family n=1 Tax=Salinihabitans flavidus TaxID=569882 RepID=A0A1H8RA84_9RHOB|nr:TerB family tellurite resistance protein [Salinihabitans flavidus]SEO63355.1 Uncharacterized conserved protein, tellurite resistance protein B (TerB) family [Salinihabitans flavidus]